MHSDKRGKLVVFKQWKEGQIYFVTFDGQKVIRGNHYHKKWREWAGIVKGRILVILINVKNGSWNWFFIDENDKKYRLVEIPPYTAHTFISLRDNAVLLNYADKPWDKKDDFKYKFKYKIAKGE